MINIICSGKIKERYLTEFIEDYKTRINKYHKIQIIEIKDENDLDFEAEKILKQIHERDYVIACCIEGTSMSSEELASFLDKSFLSSGTLDFVIGSSEGLSDKIKNRANLKLSFSKFTMPHGIFRAILLEQIYRAFKINNHETYHK